MPFSDYFATGSLQLAGVLDVKQWKLPHETVKPAIFRLKLMGNQPSSPIATNI
jgi:hypothetical protein